MECQIFLCLLSLNPKCVGGEKNVRAPPPLPTAHVPLVDVDHREV